MTRHNPKESRTCLDMETIRDILIDVIKLNQDTSLDTGQLDTIIHRCNICLGISFSSDFFINKWLLNIWKNQDSFYRSFLTRNNWCKMLLNKMLNFTYGRKVFFTIQLFEQFWAILSSCSSCFCPVVLGKLCMFPG